MQLIGFIIFGLVVGAIAKLVMPGRDPGGIIVTALVGMAGALLGGWLGRAFLGGGDNYAAGWIMAIVGTLVLLGLFRLIAGRRAVA